MNGQLTKAKRLYRLASSELNNSKEKKAEEIARDASGKAWIATTDALRGFLLSRGVKLNELPKSERHRHDLLSKHGNEKMWSLYQSIMGEIHQNAYYEGIINYPLLFSAFNNVKKFIHRCENGG